MRFGAVCAGVMACEAMLIVIAAALAAFRIRCCGRESKLRQEDLLDAKWSGGDSRKQLLPVVD